MAQRRAPKDPNASHIKAPVNNVGANNVDEYWGVGKGDPSDAGRGFCYHLWSVAGVRSTYTTWVDVIMLLLMETLACSIITVGVGLGVWYQGTNNILNALMIAFCYAASYYLATRLPSPNTLPLHGNGALTAAALITRDLGLWGWLLYTAGQFFGMMLGGGLFLGLLFKGVPGGTGILLDGSSCPAAIAPNTVAHSLVPIPVTTSTSLPTSLGTVIVLELIFALVFVLVVLIKTYLSTPTNSNADYYKQYRKGTKLGALSIFVMVVVGYQFSVWTFSNVAWGGPAFGGWSWVQDCDYTRQLNQIVNMHPAVYAGSVFVNGLASLLYLMMPWAMGLVGGLFTALILWIAFKDKEFSTNGPKYDWLHKQAAESAAAAAAADPTPSNIGASMQNNGAMRTPLLVNPATGKAM